VNLFSPIYLILSSHLYLTRASQGKIVLEQEEAFGEILSTPVSRSSMEHTKITQSATLSSYTGIRTQSFSSDPAMSMG